MYCPLLRGRRTRECKSPSGEGAECEKGSEATTTKRDRRPASEASVPSRIPGNGARFHRSWQAALEVRLLPSGRLAVRALRCWDSCCLAKDSSPALHEPRTTQASVAFVSRSSQLARSPRKRCASSPTSRPCRSTCKAGSSSGQAQKLTLTRGRVRSGSGCGKNGDGTNRCSQRRRIRRERLQRLNRQAQVQRNLRTRHECPGVIITAHETRVREDLITLPGQSWSWQRHAAGASAVIGLAQGMGRARDSKETTDDTR